MKANVFKVEIPEKELLDFINKAILQNLPPEDHKDWEQGEKKIGVSFNVGNGETKRTLIIENEIKMI